VRLANADIPERRRRDLRSAVTTYAKLVGKEAAAISLDLAELRQTLDRMVPAEAQAPCRHAAAGARRPLPLRPVGEPSPRRPRGGRR
jgi:hypothetical protein